MNHGAYNVLYVEISQKLRERAGECETAYWQDLQEQALQMQPAGGIFALTKWAFLQQCVYKYIYIYTSPQHHSDLLIKFSCEIGRPI